MGAPRALPNALRAHCARHRARSRALHTPRNACDAHCDTLTWNAEENAGMLGINTRLGFRAAATWIEMERALGGSAREASGA